MNTHQEFSRPSYNEGSIFMFIPRIISIGTANPDLYLKQSETYRFYDEHELMPAGQKSLYARLLIDGPIEGRHIALEKAEDILNESADEQIARFTAQGRK